MAAVRKHRRENLTPEEREEIREFQAAHPRMTYREIGARFKCGVVSVAMAINGPYSKPKADPKPPPKAPRCTILQPDSIIRPIPLSLLMSGRAPRAKLSPA